MKKKLIILGAGGLARQIYLIVQRAGLHDVVGFMDETITETRTMCDLPVCQNLEQLQEMATDPFELLCAVGDPMLRFRWHEEFGSKHEFASIVDPSAIIAPDAILGKDVVILGFSVCSANTRIGDSTIINWQCVVSHDSQVGSFTDISPGVKIMGNCRVGNFCQIGTNATLIPKITIGDRSIVGAGAVVIESIPEGVVAVGIPAKVIKSISY
jgi:acetyltransferase EpsM